jgi:hypothetical protein
MSPAGVLLAGLFTFGAPMKTTRMFSMILALALAGAALADVNVTTGPVVLQKGTTIVGTPWPDLASCESAARAVAQEEAAAKKADARRYCRLQIDADYRTPVNCKLSAWSLPVAGPWLVVGDHEEQITTRTKSITSPALYGGTCPGEADALRLERKVITRPLTTQPPPPVCTGTYERGPSAVTLAGTFARWPGYNAATAGPIGNVTGGTPYPNDTRTVNGSTDGVYLAEGPGFTIPVQFGATPRTVRLYLGGFNASGTLTAGNYVHTTALGEWQWNAVYSLTCTGTIQVTWRVAAVHPVNPFGNVTLQAAAIVGPAPTGTASLSWTAPTHNTDGTPLTDLAGYRVYHNDQVIPVTGTSYQFDALESGAHSFAVTAINAAGAESDRVTAAKVIP